MREITYREALREAIYEEMLRDERVFLIGEDVGIFGGTFGVAKGLLETFGKGRIINSPVSEAGIAGLATGAAITGMRPIAEIMFIDFISIAMDQIINQAAKIRYMFGGKVKVPVVFRTQGGGGRCWAAQHSQSLEALFTHIPGLKVVMPSNPYFAKGLLKSAIRDNNPVVFIEHKQLYNEKGLIPEEEYTFPLGKGAVIQEGSDITLIATSFMVSRSIEAAKILNNQGIKVEIVDPCTLVPLDKNIIINSIKKTNKVVIIQESCKRMGFGSELVRIISENCFDYLDAPPVVVGAEEVPIPFSKKLEDLALPQVETIINIIKKIFKL
jgi:pyruvate/2-oxoglutarate/acetoin dehydrogenase E1 component